MKSYVWKDPRAVTRLAVVSLSIACLIQLGSLGVWLIYQGRASYSPSQTALTSSQDLRAFFDIGLAAAYLICIPVIFWIPRVCTNAHTLSKSMTITPGWAVGWYFVPIASLFKPYESMKEIWFASSGLKEKETPLILRQWWVCFIISNAFVSVSNNTAFRENWILGMASNGMGIVVSLMLIRIIRQVCEMQINRNEMKSVFGEPKSMWDA